MFLWVGGPAGRQVKSIRMEQMQSIVEALFPCRYEPKETVAFRLYRSACALGKGVVDAYSLRKAIEACGIQHTTLRVQIHLLTTANFGIVSNVSDKSPEIAPLLCASCGAVVVGACGRASFDS